MNSRTSGLFIKFGENLSRLYPQFKKQKAVKRYPLLQSWYWQEENIFKIITLQKSWTRTAFTIELSLDTKIDNNYPHIGIIRVRLPFLIYNQDFWWDYSKNEQSSVNKAINDAFIGLQNHAFGWWNTHVKEVVKARNDYDQRLEQSFLDRKLEKQAKEKVVEIIKKEAVNVFPNLKWTRTQKSEELLFYLSNENSRLWIKLSYLKDYEEKNPFSLRLYVDLFSGDKRPYFGGRMVGPTGLQPQKQYDQSSYESDVFKTFVWKLDANSDSAKQIVKQALVKTREVLPKFLIETQ